MVGVFANIVIVECAAELIGALNGDDVNGGA